MHKERERERAAPVSVARRFRVTASFLVHPLKSSSSEHGKSLRIGSIFLGPGRRSRLAKGTDCPNPKSANGLSVPEE